MPPRKKAGVITLNPPYGKRLAAGHSTSSFYREISKKLISDFKGWRLALILPSRADMADLDLGLEVKDVFHGGMDAAVGIGLL